MLSNGRAIRTTDVNGKAYRGTIAPLVPGMTLRPQATADSGNDAVLDAGRLTEHGVTAAVVWAASSVKDATAMAAIRAYRVSRRVPHSVIRVCQVQIPPIHVAPLAILEEIQNCLMRGDSVQPLMPRCLRKAGEYG